LVFDRYRYKSDSRTILTVEFTTYTKEGEWSRTVTNILAFLGNVGGIS